MTDRLKAELAERIAAGRVLVVTRTGVSLAATVSAEHQRGNPLASWKGLTANGVQRCVDLRLDGADVEWADVQRRLLDRPSLTDLLAVAEQVQHRLQIRGTGDWREWLRETVGSLRATAPDILATLRALGAPLATLNYDGLLESPSPPRRAITWRDAEGWPRVLDRQDDAVLHLHGH